MKISKPHKPASGWVTARKWTQGISLAVFVALVIGIHPQTWSSGLADLPLRIDPLAVAAQAIASRAFLASSAAALALVLLTLVFGRAWCGWLCPLGTTLDIFPMRRQRHAGNHQPIPDQWRSVKYTLLIATIIAALFTNLTLLVFDPITIVFRSLTLVILPGMDRLISAIETMLAPLPVLQDLLGQFDSLIRPAVLPVTPAVFPYALLFLLFFILIIALNRVAHRFWCRYLCPLGAMLGWISKNALFRREVTGECKDCQLCDRACPVGTIQPARGYSSDPSECTVCMECLGACRLQGNAFLTHTRPSGWNSYDPSRRQALQTLAVTAVVLAAAQVEPVQGRAEPHLIQPPGAAGNDLTSKCIRCGECLRVCPTSGLQPAWWQLGLEGFWTPVLAPRLGYCDYSCNACGQFCPVEAIPPLSLEEKRQTVIGSAYIDQNRCIAWSDHQNCIVCEEMCPLPQKAISLQPATFTSFAGIQTEVKLPYVDRSACIGCGICENKCPVRGEAAIRIFTTETPLAG